MGIAEVIISVIKVFIEVLVIFAIGFGCGYEEGMKCMKRIDDRIIDEASKAMHGEENHE